MYVAPRHAAQTRDPMTSEQMTSDPMAPEPLSEMNRDRPARPLPLPLTSDSWFQVPAGESERYHGRRRRPEAAVIRRFLAVGAILTLTVAGLLYVLDAGPLPAMDHLPPGPAVVLPVPPSAVAVPGETAAQPGERGSTASSVVVVADPGGDIAGGSAGDPGGGGATSPDGRSGGGTPSALATALEAEAESTAAVLTGSAVVTADPDASGGFLVTGLGAQGGGQPPGTVQFTDVAVPADGTYRIRIYFTNAQPGAQEAAEVSVAGSDPVTVTFSGPNRCCGVRTVQVGLTAGSITIGIANPSGPAPAIDKIVLVPV
jgi:hypothetical protein